LEAEAAAEEEEEDAPAGHLAAHSAEADQTETVARGVVQGGQGGDWAHAKLVGRSMHSVLSTARDLAEEQEAPTLAEVAIDNEEALLGVGAVADAVDGASDVAALAEGAVLGAIEGIDSMVLGVAAGRPSSNAASTLDARWPWHPELDEEAAATERRRGVEETSLASRRPSATPPMRGLDSGIDVEDAAPAGSPAAVAHAVDAGTPPAASAFVIEDIAIVALALLGMVAVWQLLRQIEQAARACVRTCWRRKSRTS